MISAVVANRDHVAHSRRADLIFDELPVVELGGRAVIERDPNAEATQMARPWEVSLSIRAMTTPSASAPS